jgi:hypothetical protein
LASRAEIEEELVEIESFVASIMAASLVVQQLPLSICQIVDIPICFWMNEADGGRWIRSRGLCVGLEDIESRFPGLQFLVSEAPGAFSSEKLSKLTYWTVFGTVLKTDG